MRISSARMFDIQGNESCLRKVAALTTEAPYARRAMAVAKRIVAIDRL